MMSTFFFAYPLTAPSSREVALPITATSVYMDGDLSKIELQLNRSNDGTSSFPSLAFVPLSATVTRVPISKALRSLDINFREPLCPPPKTAGCGFPKLRKTVHYSTLTNCS